MVVGFVPATVQWRWFTLWGINCKFIFLASKQHISLIMIDSNLADSNSLSTFYAIISYFCVLILPHISIFHFPIECVFIDSNHPPPGGQGLWVVSGRGSWGPAIVDCPTHSSSLRGFGDDNKNICENKNENWFIIWTTNICQYSGTQI